jgi:uncharacterized protein (DUF2336 family)
MAMVERVSLIADLEEAISSGTQSRRVETLRRVTDLFMNGARVYSEDQVALFDDVIGRLAADIEARARAELSNRLASVPNAPINVVKTLAADDLVTVATPVLSLSARLTDEDLIATAKTKGQPYLLAISTRPSLSEAVTDVLVERGDQGVVIAVAKNIGARFSDSGFGLLVRRSENDDVLAEHVGVRADIPTPHLLALVTKASDAVRNKLTAANPQAAELIKRVLADVADQIGAQAARDYTAAKNSVGALISARQLSEHHVSEFARSGKFEETVCALSVLCRLPIDSIERAIIDDRLDVIVIISKAAEFCWTTTKLIIELRPAGVSGLDLDHARRNFERLQVMTAQRALRFFSVRQNLVNPSS